MKAIILAAGRGSRMKDLTDAVPKCLVRLRGVTLLDRQLSALHAAGITDIAIVTGYRRELLAQQGLVEFHNPRWAKTNMVSSLACAQAWLDEGSCIVSYSDIFYDASGVRSLIESTAALAITYDANWRSLWEKRFGDPLLDAETFRMDANHRVVEIGNKPRTLADVEGQYMGLLRITPAGWREFECIRDDLSADDRDQMHMTGTLQRVVDAGRVPVLAIPYVGDWGEVDSADDLAAYCQHRS